MLTVAALGLAVLAAVVLVVRFWLYKFMLRALLLRRPAPGVWTRAWKLLVGHLCPPKMALVEDCLPGLFVPPLSESVHRYLQSVEPLLEASQFQKLSNDVRQACRFLQPFWWLQLHLRLYAFRKRNYLRDWWLEFVFLTPRNSIAINSNFYLIDRGAGSGVADAQLRCVAHLRVFQFLLLKLWRDDGGAQQTPFLQRSFAPVSCAGYASVFGVTRIAGETVDSLQTFKRSRHIALIRHKEVYVFDIVDPIGNAVPAEQLLANIKYLMELPPPPARERGCAVAALTCDLRQNWNAARQRHFSSGLNKTSLHAVESSLFVVCLDDESPMTNSEVAAAAFHGSGGDRWFDKSFNYIVFRNGRVALNAEHAALDSNVAMHLLEALVQGEEQFMPTTDMRRRAQALFQPRVKKLMWNVTVGLESAVSNACNVLHKLAADSCLHVLEFFGYGKGLIKSCHANSDGWIQMCLQLAFFRKHRRFAMTYESCILRHFAYGRTECVRPLSNESATWCRLMDTEGISREDRLAALLQAMRVHNRRAHDARTGYGFDRHLFGLFVMSGLKQMWAPQSLLSKMLSFPFDLSTSHLPTRQSVPHFPFSQEKTPLGGGHTASTRNGYGVAFVLCNDSIFFHIHAWRGLEIDSRQFADFIERALLDVADLFK